MKKTLTLTLLSLAVALTAGGAWGVDNIPNIHEDVLDVDKGSGNPNYGFYYQLREISGEKSEGHSVAGAQWFATTYENYLWHRRNNTDDERISHPIYRRTLGGQMSEIPMETLADLLNSFDYVYVNEPTPYREWLIANGITEENTAYYDRYANPMEALCLVIPEGTGELKVNFMNHYARHFPYWYKTGMEETAALINPADVESRDIMEDVRMTVGDYDINITPSKAKSVNKGESLEATLKLTAQSAEAYGSTKGTMAFRQSANMTDDSEGWRESGLIPVVVANVHDGPASDPGCELLFDMTIRDPTVSSSLPEELAVVNRVKFYWGADDDLTQDLGKFYMMRYYTGTASEDYKLETRVTNRTGTRYRMERYDGISSTPNTPGGTDTNPGAREKYAEIKPAYWAYDLTLDNYGSLPSSFLLDAHSQIAPGLVTVYDNNLGYTTLNTAYGTSDSFRLYPFSESAYHTLTLKYTRIAGMYAGDWKTLSSARVYVRPFSMVFVDKRQNSENTEQELEDLMDATPVMIRSADLGTTDSRLTLTEDYIGKDELNGFELTETVPSDLLTASVVTAASLDKAALQPVVIRIAIPRKEQILTLKNRWAKLDAAESAEDVFKEFEKFGAVWVRSTNTRQLDRNLFKALREMASNNNYDVSDIVRAFIYKDTLYLEFMAILADAKSPKDGDWTAFLRLFKDDDIPYLLIGDGKADGKWNLSFFVTDTGEDPEDDESSSKGKDGGGGCDAGIVPLSGLLLSAAALLWRGKRR